MQAIEVRDREIEFRLEAFARARLSPDPGAIARSRARIMREARLRIDGTTAGRPTPRIVASPRRSLVRRVAMPLLAASVWLVIAVGTISAAQPGGPLYSSRMWVESLTLPAGGAARAAVELDRLGSRLEEAMAAAVRGDAGAVQAALDAYRRIADETVAGASGDEALEALIAAALDQHEVVLTAVADQLALQGNAVAAAAIEASVQRAIVHNQAVIDRVGDNATGGGAGGAGGSGDESTGGTSGGTGAGAGTGVNAAPTTSPPSIAPGDAGSGSGPTATGAPDRTPKPARSPRPVPDESIAPSQPDHGQGDQDG